MTIGDVIVDAFTEIRVARAGDELTPEQMADGLVVLNRLFDLWNANDRAIYATGFTDYTLTPSLSPHTIGPTATFVTTQRPVAIDALAVNLGGSPAVFTPIRMRDASWYAAQSVPGLPSTFPTDCYYAPAWPNGALFFWPVPTSAYGVRLWARTVLAAVAQGDTFTLPPGYQEAITLTLAERLAPRYAQQASQATQIAARQARALVFDDNDAVPRIATADAGLNARGGGGWFNIHSRSSNS